MNGSARATGIFVAAAALIAPLSVISPNALAVLMALVALAVAILDPEARRFSRVPRVLVWLFSAFFALATASLAWTLDAAEGLDGVARVAATSVLGLVLVGKARGLDETARRRTGDALAFGYLAAAALLSIQLASERVWGSENSIASYWYSPDTNFWALFNRSATVLALLLPLAVMSIRQTQGTWAAAAFAAAGAWLTFQLHSQSAELAVCIGVATAVFAAIAGHFAPRLLAAGLALAMLSAPLVARTDALAALSNRRDVSVSVYHRAAIWGFSAARIAEKPVLGWGMHAARSMPNAKETIAYGAELMPLHPHNGPLHMWLEFGFIGALIATGLLIWLALGTAGPTPDRMLRASLLAAALVVASVSYGLWQGWWMATLWLVGALAAAAPESPQDGG